MLVNSLGKNKIKITLSAFEITKLFGSYENIDYSNPEIKIALNVLLDKATEMSNTEFDEGALFVEVYPTALGGCNIYFTKIKQTDKTTKRFKKINQNHFCTVIVFEGSNDLLNAIQYLYKTDTYELIKNSLYKRKDKYNLLLVSSKPIIKKLHCLGEFAKNIYSGKEVYAFIAEHSKQIIADNAIQIIGKSFN